MSVRPSPGGGTFLFVAAVGPSTPAANAGVEPGDIVTSFNGRRAAFRDDLALIEAIGRLKIGSRLPLQLMRRGREVRTVVPVGKLPPEYEQAWRDGLAKAKAARARQTSEP